MGKRQRLLGAINGNPADANAYYKLANDMFSDETVTLFGKSWTKLSLLVKSIALDPQSASAYNFLGCYLSNTETVTLEDGAEVNRLGSYLKAVELNPTNAMMIRNVSLCVTDNETVKMPDGTSMTKRGLLLKAIELDPSDCTPFADLANLLKPTETVKLKSGTLMTQRELFVKSLKLDPTGYQGWTHRDFAKTLQPGEKATLHDGSVVTKEMLEEMRDYYGEKLDPTKGVGSFDTCTKFSSAVGDLERTTFCAMYLKTHPDVFQKKLVLDGKKNVAEQLKQHSAATTIVVTGAHVEDLTKVKGNFTASSFQVLEIRECKEEHVQHVVSLFSKKNVFNLDRFSCLRVVVANDGNARAGSEIARLCSKNVFAIEFRTPTGNTMQTSAYDCILGVAANHELSVQHFIVASDISAGANTTNVLSAGQKNPKVKFMLRKEERSDLETPFLERIANERFADSFDVKLPPIVPLREIKWDKMFGLQIVSGLVRCDFKDLHKHSVTLQNMHDANDKKGKEPSEPLEKYTGSNVGVRTAAVQLVVLYVSAKDKGRKPLFASEEATKEAEEHPNVWHLSLTDEAFLKFVAAESNDTKDEVSLCTEILGIATFLHMPALQRLIFSHLVRLWKTEKAEELKTEHEKKRGRL